MKYFTTKAMVDGADLECTNEHTCIREKNEDKPVMNKVDLDLL